MNKHSSTERLSQRTGKMIEDSFVKLNQINALIAIERLYKNSFFIHLAQDGTTKANFMVLLMIFLSPELYDWSIGIRINKK